MKHTVTQRPARLSLSTIDTRPDDFQFRTFELDQYHVEKLQEAHQRGADLGRIDVWKDPEDSQYYVLDGHHRLEAYRRAGQVHTANVTVHEGPYHRVRLVALKQNTQARLPMSDVERSNAAWRLVAGQEKDKDPDRYSKAELAKLTQRSERTIANMRATAIALLKDDQELPDSWLQAMRLKREGKQGEMSEEDRQDWVEAKAAEIDAEIGPAIFRYASLFPEAFQQVLQQRMGSMFDVMIDYHAPPTYEPDPSA